MVDPYVYITDLPPGINEMVSPCADGYTVYIKESLDYYGRIKAYSHAIEHIIGNDFEKNDVQEIETRAHQGGMR